MKNPWRSFLFLLLWLLELSLTRASSHNDNDQVAPVNYDALYQDANVSITRSGILDLVVSSPDHPIPNNNDDKVAVCHIASFLPFTYMTPVGPIYVDWEKDMAGGMAAIYLALDMLNRGDGSVISEIEGLDQTCPIRFTMETFDTSAVPLQAVDTLTTQVLKRNAANQEREVCAFLGAGLSRVTLPMAILTGIAGRVQLSPWATTSQLEDRQTYPLFARLITSEMGYVIPVVLYLKELNVNHIGIVHVNNAWGNTYVRSMLSAATTYHPNLKIAFVSVPETGATAQDYTTAMETLKRTQYKWFFMLSVNNDEQFQDLLTEAADQGMAGTGRHVWITHQGRHIRTVQSLKLMTDTPLARAARGLGIISPQTGRPGMPVFDKFVQKWHTLNQSQHHLDALQAALPQYPDFPNFTPLDFKDVSLPQVDPSLGLATLFDETIMLGLAACRAAQVKAATNDIYLDGPTMYQQILNTTFQGSTGFIQLDPDTASQNLGYTRVMDDVRTVLRRL